MGKNSLLFNVFIASETAIKSKTQSIINLHLYLCAFIIKDEGL